MPRKGWKNINIREELYDYIQSIVDTQPKLGYSTVADFVRDAIRGLLRKLEKETSFDPSREAGPSGTDDDAT